MLPDYPRIKAELQAVLDEFIRQRIGTHLGILNEVEHVTIREGKTNTRLVRPTGEVEDNPLELRSVAFEIRKEEVGKIPLAALLSRLDSAAQEMAGAMARDLYAAVTAAVDRVGNAVDGKGKKLSAQLLLEAFAKIQIDFDDSGRPILPTLHIHPSLKEAADLANTALTSDPGLKDQFDQLMLKKREEWREREASRKLVG